MSESVGYPPEVRALGVPERVFKMGAFHNLMSWGDLSNVHGGWILAVGLGLLSLAPLAMYFFAPPPSDAPAEVWFIPFGVLLLIAIIGGVCAALGIGKKAGSPSTPATSSGDHNGYLLYKNALVALEGSGPKIIQFQRTVEIQMPAMTGSSFAFKAADGVLLPLLDGVEDYEELLPIVIDRVKAFLTPAALKKIASGQTAEFGVFRIRREGIGYKEKEIGWNEVTSMEIQSGQVGRRLTIYSGGMTSWCWHDLNTVPNADVLYDVICRVAPRHLLKASTE